MALLNEEIENTTVVIGGQNGANYYWFGTGFFVFKKIENTDIGYVYLVTNRHVVENKNEVFIRVTMKTGKIETKRVTLSNCVTFHPNSAIDIAVIQLYGQYVNDNLEVRYFDIDTASYTSDEYLNEGGFEGSSIFMLGFPMGIVDNYSTTPICRKGCIARFKKNDIINSYSFILDIQNFPGNSGSPIITCPDIISVAHTKTIKKCALLGIVHSYIPYTENLASTQTGKIVEVRTENSGLALAHPIEYIKETIELDLLNRKNKENK